MRIHKKKKKIETILVRIRPRMIITIITTYYFTYRAFRVSRRVIRLSEKNEQTDHASPPRDEEDNIIIPRL